MQFINIEEIVFKKQDNPNSDKREFEVLKKRVRFEHIVEHFQDGRHYKVRLNYATKFETKYVTKKTFEDLNDITGMYLVLPDNMGNKK